MQGMRLGLNPVHLLYLADVPAPLVPSSELSAAIVSLQRGAPKTQRLPFSSIAGQTRTLGINLFTSCCRILAPSTYIFFASAIPALAFGEQLAKETDGILTGVHTLAASGITGFLQAVIGGQPLLIVGVSEPITLIYSYMYSFGRDQNDLGPNLFLAWAGWSCIWAALFIVALAFLGSCRLINRFTRFSGELFGMLIAVLFLQQAVKGLVGEFKVDKTPGSPRGDGDLYVWRLVNGLWGLVLAFGLLYTSWELRKARAWRFGPAPLRGFLADYGVPLMVAAWSFLSFALKGAPKGISRRLLLPDTWNVKTSWTVAKDLGEVPGAYIAAALIPGAIIAILFYFDHNVSSQMAQQEDFNLTKPPAYNYDFLLLGFMTLLCGLIGLPPVNGVLPQAPMHTKSLATLKKQIVRGALSKTARRLQGGEAKVMVMEMVKASEELQSGATKGLQQRADELRSPKDSDGLENGALNAQQKHEVQRDLDLFIPVEVKEQRVSNLLQSLFMLACLAITPVLKKVPTAVLWGFFAYMGLESLPGSQFWDRILLLFTSRPHRIRMLEQEHPPFLETVPFKVIGAFTIFQVLYTAAVYAVTWIPIAGILFPIPIMLLVPIRQYLLPRFFSQETLQELDAAKFEEAPPLPLEESEDGGGDSEVLGSRARHLSRELSAAGEECSVGPETSEWPKFEIKHHLTQEAMVHRPLQGRLLEHDARAMPGVKSGEV